MIHPMQSAGAVGGNGWMPATRPASAMACQIGSKLGWTGYRPAMMLGRMMTQVKPISATRRISEMASSLSCCGMIAAGKSRVGSVLQKSAIQLLYARAMPSEAFGSSIALYQSPHTVGSITAWSMPMRSQSRRRARGS